MCNIQIICNVASRSDTYRFIAAVHVLYSPEEFHMDPVEFYEKWGKAVPQGVHHELEIVEPGETFFEQHVLHMYKSLRTGKPFVCYPKAIGSLAKAVEVFTIWSIGSVLTIDQKIDLNSVYTAEYADDQPMFLKMMEDRYGIHLISGVTQQYS